MRIRITGLLILLLLCCLLFECEKKMSEDYLLRINNKDYLHAEDFFKRYIKSDSFKDNVSFSVETLKEYINLYLLDDQIYIVEAENLGYDKQDKFAAAFEMKKRQILTQRDGLLYQHVLPKPPPIDSTTLREFYDRRQFKLRIARIVVESEQLADSLYQALKAGADFGETARKFSLEFDSADRDGELPNPIYWGSMGQTFEESAFSTKVGEFSEPIYSDFTYQILKVLEKIPLSQNPFSEQDRRLRMQFIMVAKKRDMEKYISSLYDTYQVTLIDSTAKLLSQLYLSCSAEGKQGLDLSELSISQKEQLVVTFADAGWNVEQFSKEYEKQGTLAKLPLRNSLEVKNLVRRVLVPELTYIDAKALKTDQSKPFLREFKIFRDRILMKKAIQDLVTSRIDAKEYEIRDFYKMHQAEYAGHTYAEVRETCKNRLILEKEHAEVKLVAYKLKRKYEIDYNTDLLKKLADDITALRRRPAPPQRNLNVQ
ncbi:peptidylprolyl isomerase [candidate division KSB1 bacterium]|nr:peptidylprolyl isomerase [candidate division KSB1 bacterium]